MTSERQIASNRSNGGRSRGPRTAAGKASSSHNAFRHGLAVSVLDRPATCAEAERLARAIAGSDADNLRLDQARIIAEAQVDLVRIQDAKVRVLNSHIVETMSADPGHEATRYPQAAAANLESQSYDALSETRFAPGLVMAPTIEGLRQLAKLERYEHRAVSRRRRAICAFLV
jgi:hypothetical protein